jgi:hypothetical protein
MLYLDIPRKQAELLIDTAKTGYSFNSHDFYIINEGVSLVYSERKYLVNWLFYKDC